MKGESKMATIERPLRENELEKEIDKRRRNIIKEDRVEKVQGPDPWPDPPKKDTDKENDI